MTLPDSLQTIEVYDLENLSLSDNISLLLEKLSNPDNLRNSILQKPLIYKLISLLVSQNPNDLSDNNAKYYVLFKNHISNDLFEFMLEELSGYIKTNNYQSTFIIIIMLKVQTYTPLTIKPLKSLTDKLRFDSTLNTPNITNENDVLSLGSLVSYIFEKIVKMIENSKKMEIDNKYIDRQIHTETLQYLKYLMNIPIKITLKAQQYNPTIPSQTLLAITASYETIMELENLKINPSNLNNILKTFKFRYHYGDNCSFLEEYLYQIIISLIHQHIPCDCPDELDEDIFNAIRCYQLKNEHFNILINYYLKMFIPTIQIMPLSLKLKIIYIFSVYIKIPVCHNDESILYYLDVIDTFTNFICGHIKPSDGIINIQPLFSLVKTILLFLTNIYLYGSNRHIEKLIYTLRTLYA